VAVEVAKQVLAFGKDLELVALSTMVARNSAFQLPFRAR
jgi:hypothetical protein